MKTITKLLKIMLRLWFFILTLSVVCIQSTTAETAAATTAAPATQLVLELTETPASLPTATLLIIDNNLQLLLETSTSKDLRFDNEEKVLKQTQTITTTSTISSEPFTPTVANPSTTTTSFSTIASSNAPATITNQAKHLVTTQTLDKGEEDKEKSEKNQEYLNNDKSATEEKENTIKQVTQTVESVIETQHQQQLQQQQQQQEITTDVALQTETDMHIQSTGNAGKTKNDIETTTIAETKKQLTTTNEAILTTTHIPEITENEHNHTTTNIPLLTTTMMYDTTLLQHATENVGDYIKHTETDAKGDDIKHHTVTNTTDITPTAKITPFPSNTQQIDSITLTLASVNNNKQAMEDFKPLIQDANEKLIKERTIFSPKPVLNNEEWKQNLMPNEVDYEDKIIPLKTNTKAFEHNINWSPYLHPATPVTDFTGKLLQEQDGVITEIEQKFRLNEFAGDTETKPTKNPLELKKSTQEILALKDSTIASNNKEMIMNTYSVNHEILNKSPVIAQTPYTQFIERRVKKSFDFPMHRVASDALHMPQHFDFANTKFNSNNQDPLTQAAKTQEGNLLQPGQTLDGSPAIRPQPEFSTTKFYNSKELYNEMLLHKSKQQQQHDLQNIKTTKKLNLEIEESNHKTPSLSLNSFAVLHSPKIAKLEEIHELKEPQQKTLTIKQVTVKSTKHTEISKPSSFSSSPFSTPSSTSSTATTTKQPSTSSTTTTTTTTTTEIPLETVLKTKKFQKELKRAKLLIKTMMPLQNSTTLALLNNNNELKTQQTVGSTSPISVTPQLQMELAVTSTTTTYKPNFLTSLKQSSMEITSNTQSPNSLKASATSSSTPQPFVSSSISSSSSTNPPKSSIKPIVRPRILSRLQEKINSLECELQNLPQDSHLWRGNETHELLLPIMICKPNWTPTTWFANNIWINSENCSAGDNTPENCKTDKDCTAMMVSWEGEAEIQSGDILIVEINDALLTPKDINLTTSAHNTQVYQVTRSGHEHCDVTEGILLDITPLIVDGRKLVTLYDKDLTEGVNLLIVVSELWGSQCVRLKVTTKTENCGENADCSGKGICYSNYDMEEYECQCCSGFAGPHCEEIDACTPSPCTNNGICVDLSQGHEGNSYQCLCPYGYTGKNCQYELDPCNPAECMNGGSCVGNSTHFRCECTPGYAGPLCQHSLNECESSPCIHGICVDQEDGFRCFCQPGFAGELCNFEYNECESNPCQNAGECIDHIGSYECHCTKGYTGNRCQIKVDFCANKPCPEGRRCIDHGNDYSCECLGGRNGPDCNEMQRTQCNVNPCTHGGTCWSSGDSFYCACRAGYTGTMCEDEFVVETVVSSSEFMVDDTSARNFNDKSFGSSVVLKSPIELHNAYTAAIVLALVIFFVALYLTICHCKVNQTYRKFSTRTYGFLPILGFRLRTKQATSKISRHWLSGKGLGGVGNVLRTTGGEATATSSTHKNNVGHLPTANASSNTTQQQHHTHVGQLNERPFQRHLAMNLENDMYYTVDFSENSQHSPLIQ